MFQEVGQVHIRVSGATAAGLEGLKVETILSFWVHGLGTYCLVSCQDVEEVVPQSDTEPGATPRIHAHASASPKY